MWFWKKKLCKGKMLHCVPHTTLKYTYSKGSKLNIKPTNKQVVY